MSPTIQDKGTDLVLDTSSADLNTLSAKQDCCSNGHRWPLGLEVPSQHVESHLKEVYTC